MEQRVLPYLPSGNPVEDGQRTLLAYLVASVTFLAAAGTLFLVFFIERFGWRPVPVSGNPSVAIVFVAGPLLVLVEGVLLIALRNRMNAGCGAWAMTVAAGCCWAFSWYHTCTD